METLTSILIVVMLLIDTLLMVAITVYEFTKDQELKTEPVKNYGMTEDQLQKFAESDAKVVNDFNSVIADLHTFMTGDEEDTNAERQTF